MIYELNNDIIFCLTYINYGNITLGTYITNTQVAWSAALAATSHVMRLGVSNSY